MPEAVQLLYGKLDDRKKWQEWETKDLRPLWDDAKATETAPGMDEKFRQSVNALFVGTGKQPQRDTLVEKLQEWKKVVKTWRAREGARQQAASRRAAESPAPKGGGDKVAANGSEGGQGGQDGSSSSQVVEDGDEEVRGGAKGKAADEVGAAEASAAAVTTEKHAAVAPASAASAAPAPMDTTAVAEGTGAESRAERAAIPEPHPAEPAMPSLDHSWLERVKPRHLKKLCEEKGLVSYGNSQVLAKRLRDKGGLSEDELKKLGGLCEVDVASAGSLAEASGAAEAAPATPAKRRKLEAKPEAKAEEDAKVEVVAAQCITIGQPVAQQPVHAQQAQTAMPSSEHVSLPKPRQPTKQNKGDDWIKVRIELEQNVKVEPTYEFEVEYRPAGPHGPSKSHIMGFQSVFCASSLTEGEKYVFRVRVKQGASLGPWSNWSSALVCKKGRELIDPGTKRKMWADLYPSAGDDEETGSRLDQPCLGCQARKVRQPVMLSPLLDNVDASHVIADSLGGPSGDKVEHSWNLVPLCSDCNRNHQKTKNMVDWMLDEGRKGSNFMPLYELLIRLRRACIKNNLVDKTSALPYPLSHLSHCTCPHAHACRQLTDYPSAPVPSQSTWSTSRVTSSKSASQGCCRSTASAPATNSMMAALVRTRTPGGRADSSPRGMTS